MSRYPLPSIHGLYRDYIRKVKEVTEKPFGVNVMLMSPYADDVAKVVVEEGVKVVTTGAGNPEKYMDLWKLSHRQRSTGFASHPKGFQWNTRLLKP